MVTKTSRTYRFSQFTLSLIDKLKALPEYGSKSTQLLELLVLEKARALGVLEGNGNNSKRKNGGGKK
jgi:hypothetical protein